MSNGGVPIGSSVSIPTCPIGGEDLRLGSQGELDYWSCPAGHGLAMTLSESHLRLQDDEVAELWQLARVAEPGPLMSPFGQRQMVRVTLPYDDDELPAADGDASTSASSGSVVLDVDLEEQFIWFDAGELDLLPADLANAEPTAEELAAVAQIRARFGSDIEADLEARDDHEISERIYNHIATRPGVLKVLDDVGRTVTTY
ncbi:hypothetical protein BH10ACT3_BH10ACT3_05000 [soil metagenome]